MLHQTRPFATAQFNSPLQRPSSANVSNPIQFFNSWILNAPSKVALQPHSPPNEILTAVDQQAVNRTLSLTIAFVSGWKDAYIIPANTFTEAAVVSRRRRVCSRLPSGAL